MDVATLYLSEQLNNDLYYTLEKLIFLFIYIFFVRAFFGQSEENFVKCSHDKKEGKFSDSQIFHFDESSKSGKTHITNVWISIIIFPLYKLYKIVGISVICYSSRACSKCAIIRPRQHCLAVLASSTPILSLLVFIYATFSGLEVHTPRTCPNYGKEIMVASPSTALSSFL